MDDDTASDPSEIASLFANFFKSVFSDAAPPSADSNLDPLLDISEISLSLVEIFEGLSSLKCDVGPGLDSIPNSFLKEVRFSVARPLWLLFNKSLSSGVFPEIWKNSLIRPIFKSGNKEDVRNYRLIALLNSIPKFFEKLVSRQLKAFIGEILIDEQHGFTEGRSTTTNYTLLNNYLFKNLDRGA